MRPIKNQPDRIYHYLAHEDLRVADPVDLAIAMANEGFSKLRIHAETGDERAIKILHSLACYTVAVLNEDFSPYANKVVKWPVILSQDPKQRSDELKDCKKMRIGSAVLDTGGAPDNLDRNTNKGFAIYNLQRVSHARDLLRSSCFDGFEHSSFKANGHFDPWYADEEYLSVVFTIETEIDHKDTALLLEIRDLPDYDPASRPKWIELILKVLKAHPLLIPASIKEREKTNIPVAEGKPKKQRQRGGMVKKALTEGLRNVDVVPEKCWH